VRRAPRNYAKFPSPILHMQISQCRDPLERGNAIAVKAVHASTSAPGLPFGGRSTTVGGLMPLGRALRRSGAPEDAGENVAPPLFHLLPTSRLPLIFVGERGLMSSRNTSDPNHWRDRAVHMRALALTMKTPRRSP
jgi:hypothetical protein